MKKPIIFIVSIFILGIAWYLISPLFISIEMTENAPISATSIVEAPFQPDAHEVEGSAQLLRVDAGHIIRFEDFNTTNGPNLHIYLSKDLDANEYIDLGPIKATKGSVNYAVPSNIDPEQYPYVLVWCKPFSVLFSFADLKKDT